MYRNCSVTKSCLALCNPMDCAHQASLSFTIFRNLLKLMSTETVMSSNHLLLCRPLLLLPSIFPNTRVFSSESALRIRWPKYWCSSINSFNQYSGLINFRIEWSDLLAVQGTLKSSPTPQLESINSSALSLLYGPTLISKHDYKKNHSFDYTDLGSLYCITGTNIQCCRSIIPQKQTNSQRKRDQICGYQKMGKWIKAVRRYKLPVLR